MTSFDPPCEDAAVRAAFEAFPDDARGPLLSLRTLIFGVAAETPGVGPLTETLKWGQPSYLTAKTKSGSTIRLGVPKTGGFALYTHCQTSIMSDFQALAGEGFTFEGNRGVIFAPGTTPPPQLRELIRGALTYHMR